LISGDALRSFLRLKPRLKGFNLGLEFRDLTSRCRARRFGNAMAARMMNTDWNPRIFHTGAILAMRWRAVRYARRSG
jgi:hypothetical protein